MFSDPRRLAVAGVLVASLALVPAAAARGSEGGRDGGAGSVQRQLRVAERALDRAVDFDEEGDAAGAATAFDTNRRRTARALRIARRQKSGRGLEQVTRAQHATVSNALDLVDGGWDELVPVLDTAIDGALDGRDDVLAIVTGAAEADRASFARLLARIGAASASEASDVADSYGGSPSSAGRALLRGTLAREVALVESAVSTLESWGADLLDPRSLQRLQDAIEDAQEALGGLSGLSGDDADAVSAALSALGGAHGKVAALVSAAGGDSTDADYPGGDGDSDGERRDCEGDGRGSRGPAGGDPERELF